MRTGFERCEEKQLIPRANDSAPSPSPRFKELLPFYVIRQKVFTRPIEIYHIIPEFRTGVTGGYSKVFQSKKKNSMSGWGGNIRQPSKQNKMKSILARKICIDLILLGFGLVQLLFSV